MKTMADILRERGKLGPYGTPAQESPAPECSHTTTHDVSVPGDAERTLLCVCGVHLKAPWPPAEAPKAKRPRKLPPVDF